MDQRALLRAVRRRGGVGERGVDGGSVQREGEDEVRSQVEREDVEVREGEGKDCLRRVRVGVIVELGDLCVRKCMNKRFQSAILDLA